MLNSLIEKWKSIRSKSGGLGNQPSPTIEPEKRLECPTHGESFPTYICKHLNENPIQIWYCAHPSIESPWPDAWCVDCDAEYQKEGEWNERNDSSLKITMICSGCYENKRADCVQTLQGSKLQEWEEWSKTTCNELKDLQDKLTDEYPIDDYPRWDYCQETATLVFSGADSSDLIADIEFVGTLSTATNTFKWSWANFNLLDPVRSRISAVRDFGELNEYPHLYVPKWTADLTDGWLMAGASAKLMGGIGAYRAPTDHGFIFMVIMSMRNRNELN